MAQREKCNGSECKRKPVEQRNDAEPEHGCPYSEEIGDGSVRCVCCRECRMECLYDI